MSDWFRNFPDGKVIPSWMGIPDLPDTLNREPPKPKPIPEKKSISVKLKVKDQSKTGFVASCSTSGKITEKDGFLIFEPRKLVKKCGS